MLSFSYHQNSCYCCGRQPSMELDTALNELGMLSVVTDSRKQYLQERTSIKSQVYAASSSRNSSVDSAPVSPSTCQVIQMNRHYVTNVSTGPLDKEGNSITIDSDIFSNFGAKYRQTNLNLDTRAHRISRLRMARISRFKKPYQLPWRHSMEDYLLPSSNEQLLTCGSSADLKVMEKSNSGRKTTQPSSNSNSPEKQWSDEDSGHLMQRSRSLDNLDFSKLKIAEAENQTLFLQSQEIERMSENLKDLQVD